MTKRKRDYPTVSLKTLRLWLAPIYQTSADERARVQAEITAREAEGST